LSCLSHHNPLRHTVMAQPATQKRTIGLGTNASADLVTFQTWFNQY
jgi:hypothetical protein